MLLRGGGSVCRDGGVFTGIGVKRVKERLGSAENPSVSPALSLSKVLREPPSLGSRLRSNRATPSQGEGVSYR